jgi:hypothetical protein
VNFLAALVVLAILATVCKPVAVLVVLVILAILIGGILNIPVFLIFLFLRSWAKRQFQRLREG